MTRREFMRSAAGGAAFVALLGECVKTPVAPPFVPVSEPVEHEMPDGDFRNWAPMRQFQEFPLGRISDLFESRSI